MNNGLPPTLIIHGTNDRNVPFSTAKEFADKMKLEVNDIDFYPLEGAGHFIWWGQYAKQVSELRSDFLNNLGY
ncbi:MAG: prolyl oligopeptidase family serine peptidase [Bacteroidales bacterium]|nr:prolyl oligopeptidase family serine peptidase [Bacteroidales bacterium]